jgi:hypothetical protein
VVVSLQSMAVAAPQKSASVRAIKKVAGVISHGMNTYRSLGMDILV